MQQPGHYMRREIAEAPGVFSSAVSVDYSAALAPLDLKNASAIYTIARGSSDAAANILSYEWMRVLGLPMTSLPPSVFSLGEGVAMQNAAAIVISQSGASDDLVRSAKGIRDRNGRVVAITNVEGSKVESEAQAMLRIGAGPELAVPATKTVIGAVAAGMAGLASLIPEYKENCAGAAQGMKKLEGAAHPKAKDILADLKQYQSVFVVGRGAGFGAAHELALKIKETCALHAEAYSGAEVLHGPLQLVKKPLLVLMLDTGEAVARPSLDAAEKRFREVGARLHRVSCADMGLVDLAPAASAAALLYLIYPIVLETALALGFDPDSPETLSKVTETT